MQDDRKNENLQDVRPTLPTVLENEPPRTPLADDSQCGMSGHSCPFTGFGIWRDLVSVDGGEWR